MNLRFWKGVVAGWAVASAILYAIHQIILKSAWEGLVASGIVNADYASYSTNALFALGIFVGVYLMAELLEKLPLQNDLKALKRGAQIGLLVGLTEAGQFLIYPIPLFLALSYCVADVVAFAGAAVVYRRVDPKGTRK